MSKNRLTQTIYYMQLSSPFVSSGDTSETATGTNDLLPLPTRHSGGAVPEDSLPGHLHARGGSTQDQPTRISRTGMLSFPRHVTSKRTQVLRNRLLSSAIFLASPTIFMSPFTTSIHAPCHRSSSFSFSSGFMYNYYLHARMFRCMIVFYHAQTCTAIVFLSVCYNRHSGCPSCTPSVTSDQSITITHWLDYNAMMI